MYIYMYFVLKQNQNGLPVEKLVVSKNVFSWEPGVDDWYLDLRQQKLNTTKYYIGYSGAFSFSAWHIFLFLYIIY